MIEENINNNWTWNIVNREWIMNWGILLCYSFTSLVFWYVECPVHSPVFSLALIESPPLLVVLCAPHYKSPPSYRPLSTEGRTLIRPSLLIQGGVRDQWEDSVRWGDWGGWTNESSVLWGAEWRRGTQSHLPDISLFTSVMQAWQPVII